MKIFQTLEVLGINLWAFKIKPEKKKLYCTEVQKVFTIKTKIFLCLISRLREDFFH